MFTLRVQRTQESGTLVADSSNLSLIVGRVYDYKVLGPLGLGRDKRDPAKYGWFRGRVEVGFRDLGLRPLAGKGSRTATLAVLGNKTG